MNFARPCNSRNINQSPLCKLSTKSGTLKWADQASELYNNIGDIPDYVKTLGTPTRSVHGTSSMAESALLPSHVKVNKICKVHKK